MEVDPRLVTVFVSFISAVSAALITAWLAYKRIKTELTSVHRHEFIKKQIEACEKLWTILEPFSFTAGDERVIIDPYENPSVAIETAKKLTKRMMEVFYSPAGLYYSRDLRGEFLALRDFIRDEFISHEKETYKVNISKTKMKQFRKHVTRLRNAIRAEIGTEDLKVAKEGPLED